MSEKREISVLVTIDDAHYDFKAVAQRLQRAGLHKLDLMPVSGVVGGTADLEVIDKLKEVEGVEAVELQAQSHAL